MYPRLQLLKELLHDEGAIFVSIDDNEVAPLRLPMDEIFGPENFVANIIWRNSTGPKQSRLFSTSHDYILAFAKKAECWKRNLLPRTPEQEADYDNPDHDPRGPWRSGGLDARNYYSKGRYSITCRAAKSSTGHLAEATGEFPRRPSGNWMSMGGFGGARTRTTSLE